MPRYQKPRWFTKHIFNATVALATRVGVSVWGSRLLWVKGRKTGQWRNTPVNLLNYAGNKFLVAPRGETQWVRNLRAEGGGELALGRRKVPFRAKEISNEEKPAILRAYLRRWKAEVGIFFDGVSADSPDEDLARIAREHPVFQIL